MGVKGVLAHAVARAPPSVSFSRRIDRDSKRGCPRGAMDSSDGHSDSSHGSGSGRETRRKKRAGGTRDRGPKWACSKATFQEWLWESEPVGDAMGLHKWYTGTNRDEAQSADVRVRARYDEENRRLFRVVLKQLETGKGQHPGKENANDDKIGFRDRPRRLRANRISDNVG